MHKKNQENPLRCIGVYGVVDEHFTTDTQSISFDVCTELCIKNHRLKTAVPKAFTEEV